MYKVVKFFTDSQDNGYAYNVGDEYPRQGATVGDARIALLASSRNRQGTPLIVEVQTKAPAPVVEQKAFVEKVAPQATKPKAGTQPKKTNNRKKENK